MNTVEMLITPEQAKEWLDKKNTRNRILSMDRAAMYAADMINGDWQKTHQGIAFYDDGVLADGQTRLKAIVIANKPITMMVSFGLEQHAAIGIDAHRMRTTANQIEIHGGATWLGKNEISTARLMLQIAGKPNNISATQLVEYCNSKKPIIEFSTNNMRTNSRHLATASIKAAIASAVPFEPADRLKEFCKVLTSGVMKTDNDIAAIRLRERFLQDGAHFQSSRTSRIESVKLTQKAINLFCSNKQVKRIHIPTDFTYKL